MPPIPKPAAPALVSVPTPSRVRLPAILAAITTAVGVIGTVASDPRTLDLAHADWRTAGGIMSALLTGGGIVWQAYNKSVDRHRDPSVVTDPAAMSTALAAGDPTPDEIAMAASARANRAALADARQPAAPSAPAGDAPAPPAAEQVLIDAAAQVLRAHLSGTTTATLPAAVSGVVSVLGVLFPAAAPVAAVAGRVAGAVDAALHQPAPPLLASDAGPGVPAFVPGAPAALIAPAPSPIPPASNPAGFTTDAAGKVTV